VSAAEVFDWQRLYGEELREEAQAETKLIVDRG
jgi:hypothetical protein